MKRLLLIAAAGVSFADEAPKPVEEMVVVGVREGEAKKALSCVESERAREQSETLIVEDGPPGASNPVTGEKLLFEAKEGRVVTLGEYRDVWRRYEKARREMGIKQAAWKTSRLDEERLFPEMKCVRLAREALERRGKVLKAKMVDGRIQWVKE